MAEYDLSFSPSSTSDEGSFKLVELPSELCQLIETSLESLTPLSFSIRGQSSEDAVLCTSDKTYSVRSVVLSNSILIVTPPPDSDSSLSSGNAVIIRDQVNEILELLPSVPKLHKLSALLKGFEYDGEEEDEDMEIDETKREQISYEGVRKDIQASDAELDRGMKQYRILNINNQLRPITPKHLNTLLELLLNLLVSHSLSHESAPVEELSSALADEHEIPRQVSTQVMAWFGELREGKWKMDVEGVLKQVGLGILRHYKQDDPVEREEFITKWKLAVGDTFESLVSLELLSGNYLLYPSPVTADDVLTYFPASALPVDPAQRFADLFITRSRWKEDAILPFLADIAVNSKERDKLLLKYTRSSTDAQGVWYTARGTYNV